MLEKIKSKITIQDTRTPKFSYAFLVILVILSMVVFPIVLFKADVRVMFLLSWPVAFGLCMLCGYSYEELQKGMFVFAQKALSPAIFFLCIGAMSGIWNASGTIAYVIDIGLDLINPNFYFVTSFIIAIVFTLMTGTSWGTLSTIGVALMSVGLFMGIDPISAAAPLICGAYLADCTSPISDTTVLISGAYGLDLFGFIKYTFVRITFPTIIITAIYYYFTGLNFRNSAFDTSTMVKMMEDISVNFNLGVITLLPIVVVMVMLILKSPTIPALLGGAISGLVIAVGYQGISFGAAISAMYKGFKMQSGNAFIDSIFSRGGMTSMTGPTFLMLIAFCTFGILSTVGILDKVTEPLTKKIRSNVGATTATIVLGLVGNLSNAAFSYVFTGNIMSRIYEEKNINKFQLGNALVAGGMWCSFLIPWSPNVAATSGFLKLDDTFAMVGSMLSMFIFYIVLYINAFIYDLKNKKNYTK